MNRTTALLVASLSALSALVLLLATSVASIPSPPRRCVAPGCDAPDMPVLRTGGGRKSDEVCVRGPGGAAAAAAEKVGAVIRDGRVDVERLAEVSRLAARLERAAEREGAAPAWPQRMGLDAAGAPIAAAPACVRLAP